MHECSSNFGDEYFGVIYLECRGCNDLKMYWIYINFKDTSKSFYSKIDENITEGYIFSYDNNTNGIRAFSDKEVPEKIREYLK